MMTPDQLAAIRERTEKATPGPWWVEGTSSLEVVTLAEDLTPGASFGPTHPSVTHDPTVDDAAFIAAARTDIPRLLDEVERLRTARSDALPLYEAESAEDRAGFLQAICPECGDVQDLDQDNPDSVPRDCCGVARTLFKRDPL
jgi:hypothetical protein